MVNLWQRCHWGKGSFFSDWHWVNWIFIWKKKKAWFYLMVSTTNNSQRIMDLNHALENNKTSRKKCEDIPSWPWQRLKQFTKSTNLKEKTDKLEHLNLKNLYSSKDTSQEGELSINILFLDLFTWACSGREDSLSITLKISTCFYRCVTLLKTVIKRPIRERILPNK